MNLTSHVEKAALWSPERTAFLFEGQSLTYGELERQARQLAAGLARVGVRRRDRVALYLPNIPQFAVVYLGVQKLGAVAVSMKASFRGEEAAQVLRETGTVALFTTATLLDELAPARPRLSALRQVILCEGQAVGAAPLSALLATSLDPAEEIATEVMATADPAAILFTAGTSGGRPRGVVLTHGNLISNYLAAIKCIASGPDDRHLLYLPLSDGFGQSFIMNAVLGSAGTIVLQRRYDRQAALAAVRHAQVTHFHGLPAAYADLLEAAVEPAALASVRSFISVAATMPGDVARSWRTRFGSPIYEGYGLTETSPLAAYNHPGEYRAGSLGVPVVGVQMKVVDEEGSTLAAEQRGEICIKGPNVMAGYVGGVRETAAVLRHGWLHTGDVGYRDPDGYYYLVERLSDRTLRD